MSGVDEFAKWLGYAVMFACGTAAVSGLVIGAVFLLELAFLRGAERLTGIPVDVLVSA